MLAIAAATAARRLRGESPAPVRVRTLNHIALAVADPDDTIDFYQDLFGLPIQARNGSATLLRLGPGPQFLAITPRGSEPSRITHFCLGVQNFDAYDLVETLEARGLKKTGDGLNGASLQIEVQLRGPDAGGAPDGTPQLYFSDRNGIVIQLQHPSYCGGASVLGNLCDAPQPADRLPAIPVRDFNHLTMCVRDPRQANAFYQELFGLPTRNVSGSAIPSLAVGAGSQFLRFVDCSPLGTAAPLPGIHHACLGTEDFRPEAAIKALETRGIKAGDQLPSPLTPLRYYFRRDMRGDSTDQTSRLYVTDPDGILMQIQDVSYCGGTGPRGNICATL